MLTVVSLVCMKCGKGFERQATEVKRCQKRGLQKVFCSQSCASSFNWTPRGKAFEPQNPYCSNRKLSDFRYFLKMVEYRNRKKRKESDLTVEYLEGLWIEQGGICPLSGQAMTLPLNTTGFSEVRGPWNASLDRIDSAEWYLRGNVRFICLIANLAKAHWGDAEVIQFCKQV